MGISPQLPPGEFSITKPSIGVISAKTTPALSTTLRIDYGIYHPVLYNVKVKRSKIWVKCSPNTYQIWSETGEGRMTKMLRKKPPIMQRTK